MISLSKLELDSQKQMFKGLLGTIKKVISQPPFRMPDKWADENFFLSSESSSYVGPWRTLPAQRAVLNAMGNRAIKDLVIMKSARVGYSKMLLAYIAYNACLTKYNTVAYFPTDSMRDQYTKIDVNTTIPTIPIWREHFPAFNRVRSPDNTNDLKKFLGCILYLRGVKSPNNLRSISVDIVLCDEIDDWDSDTQGEGNPIDLARKRRDASARMGKSVVGSTPTTMGVSHVARESEKCDVQMKYHTPCPSCNAAQPLEFGGKDFNYGFKWENKDASTVKYKCNACGYLFSEVEYRKDLDKKGFWYCGETGISTRDGITFYDRDGVVVTTPRSVSMHLWTANCSIASWEDIVRGFLKSSKSDRKDIDLKSFWNTTLGLPWEDVKSKRVSGSALARNAKPFLDEAPSDEIMYITLGIDQQSGVNARFEGQYVGWARDNKKYVLDYFIHPADVNNIDDWLALIPYSKRLFTSPNSGKIPVMMTCIDIGDGNYVETATGFILEAQRTGVDIFGVKGDGRIEQNDYIRPMQKRPAYIAYVNMIKDQLTNDLSNQGDFTFSNKLPTDYFKQLASESRDGRTGQWSTSTKGIRNEALDTLVYNYAANHILRIRSDTTPFNTKPIRRNSSKDMMRNALGIF